MCPWTSDVIVVIMLTMIMVAVHAIDVKDVNIAEPWPNVNIRIKKEKEMLEEAVLCHIL